FRVKILSANRFEFWDEETEEKSEKTFGTAFKTSVGNIILLPNTTVSNASKNQIIYIKILPFISVVQKYKNGLMMEASGSSYRKNNVITLSLVDNVKEKAVRIIDELVQEYNRDAINDKKL